MDYIFKSISNAKEMIERKPNQSTVDYKIYGVLTDCETIIKALHKAINEFTANAPSVIRCKDCKHHGSEDCPLFTDAVEFVTDDDWFCADGQKEDDGDD